MIPFKLVGYCDESEDETSLVITCVFARAADWSLIVPLWQALLNEYEIPEFHAENCFHRTGFWASWTNPADRLAAANRFLDLITVNNLPSPTVYATAVDLKCFKEIAAPMIQASHPGKRLHEPWLLAFHQVLDDMLKAQRYINETLGSHEKVDLMNIPQLFTAYSSNSLPLCSMHNITFVYSRPECLQHGGRSPLDSLARSLDPSDGLVATSSSGSDIPE